MESLFAERFKTSRLQKGLTLEDIATGIQSNKSTLSQYETGKRKPDHEMIIKISEYLGISADYLLGLIDDSSGKIKHNRVAMYHQINGLLREYFSDEIVSQAEKDTMFKDITAMYWKYKK